MGMRLTGGVLALAAIATPTLAPAQQARPVSTYWMTADTQTGGVGGMSGAMALISGGRPSTDVQHLLQLQLASSQAPAGAPAAEHLPPAGLRLGERLPLATPRTGAPGTDDGAAGRVEGRVLVYWGCGERAGAGQPMVIDLAQPGAGAGRLATDLGSFTMPPAPASGRTYGAWPNGRTPEQPPANASLLGEHVVRGNYTPEFRFSLAPGQDFLPSLQLSGTSPNDAGVTPLSWRSVTGARGYFASVVGADDRGDTVIWTSSEVPVLAGQIPDHLGPQELERLIARKAVMGAETTRCAIPAQVGEAAPAAMLRVVAYGGEVDAGYPARPADARASWAPESIIKVRYASIATAMMGLFDDAEEADESDPDAPPPEEPGAVDRVRGLFKRFGG